MYSTHEGNKRLTGSVDVHYCSTHNNHKVSQGHLRIPHETRMKIAAQLQQGVTIERIIDNIRNNTMEGITREYLVPKQDTQCQEPVQHRCDGG